MLAGGFGFLSRLYGLSIDNLVEVEMVLADGRIIVVNKEEYPGPYNLFLGSRRQLSYICGRPLVGPSRRRTGYRCCHSL
jgi:FAD/FMN-containing dehydrogenase